MRSWESFVVCEAAGCNGDQYSIALNADQSDFYLGSQ